MGVSPTVAIPAAVKQAGLEISDIDVFKINKAFGSQFVYYTKVLDLDMEKVNINGGAMAIGHPLGTMRAWAIATLLHKMKKHGKDTRYGIVLMCIGIGMGAMAIFEIGSSVDECTNAHPIKKMFLSKDAL